MKRKILYTLLMLSLFTAIFCLLKLNEEKEYIPIMDTDFVNYLEKKECSLDTYIEDENLVLAETYLVTNNCQYYLTYADFSNDTTLNSYIESLKSNIEENSEEITEIKRDDFYQYSSLAKNYQILVQVGSTVIFADVESKYQEEINNILKDLNYYNQEDTLFKTLLTISIVIFVLSLLLIIIFVFTKKRIVLLP